MKLIRLKFGGAYVYYPAHQVAKVVASKHITRIRFIEDPTIYAVDDKVGLDFLMWLADPYGTKRVFPLDTIQDTTA